jgi:hypothetical protein
VYEKIVERIDKHLTPEQISFFYTLFQSETHKKCNPVQKEVRWDDLHAELNKIEFTHHPEFKEMSERPKSKPHEKEKEEMISKNMTRMDIEEEKVSRLDIKLQIFRDSVFKKKERSLPSASMEHPPPPEIRTILLPKK